MMTNNAALSLAVENAAIVEATRLCDQAFAGMARLATLPFATPAEKTRARAKRYQIEEFARTSSKVNRAVSDIGRGEWASREQFLAAIDLYCAAGIAEVERRFRATKNG